MHQDQTPNPADTSDRWKPTPAQRKVLERFLKSKEGKDAIWRGRRYRLLPGPGGVWARIQDYHDGTITRVLADSIKVVPADSEED